MRNISACLLTLGAILFCTAAAVAHKWTMPNDQVADAGWIEEHHSECCGREDCFPVPVQDLRLVAGGWKVRGHPNVIPEDQVLRSRDGKAWKCVQLIWDDSGQHIRCLFLPDAGV